MKIVKIVPVEIRIEELMVDLANLVADFEEATNDFNERYAEMQIELDRLLRIVK